MRIVVLGAGISGLAVGWFLKQKWGKKIDLTILEKKDRAGGWIRSFKAQEFLFEAGPRGFSPAGKGEATLELVHSLGLENALIPANKQAKKRYVCLNGKLQQFGLGFLLRNGLAGACLHDLKAPKSVLEDETIASFIERRFNHRLAETVMDPLTKGIFGGDIHTLSMRSCFPKIWGLEQEYGSILRGYFANRKKKKKPAVPVYTFKNGMETLTQSLCDALAGHIQLGHGCDSLDAIHADWIISTLPSYALAKLTRLEDPCSYITLSLVHLGWHRPVLTQKGYGFLIPSVEKGEILGMTWDSEVFPCGDQTRICVMIRGEWSEEELFQRASKSLKQYLTITTPPDIQKVTIARQAITQYTLHHEKRMEHFKKQLPFHLKAIGTSFSGPGVNDAIYAARATVQELLF